MPMPDTDRDNASKCIQIAFACFIPDVLHPALNQHQRLPVVEENPRIQEFPAEREHFVRRGSMIWPRLKFTVGKRNFSHDEGGGANPDFSVEAMAFSKGMRAIRSAFGKFTSRGLAKRCPSGRTRFHS